MLSRFFSDAENFPLGTALFFAFLISLLISLYDRYKPIYDARFPTRSGVDLPQSRKLRGMIDRAPFGATGHESSRVIFGAAALGDVSKADADRTLELLLEHGINHIDVAASYGDAELRIATWLKEHRFFVATKTGPAHVRRGAGGDPALARAARGRPRGLDPAAQPVRRDRVGHRR